MPRSLAASASVPACSMASKRSALPGPMAISSPWRTRSRGRRVLTDILEEDSAKRKMGGPKAPRSPGPPWERSRSLSGNPPEVSRCRKIPVMETTRFRSYAPDQLLLLPSDLREWLPEGHAAYFVLDVLGE